MNRICLIVLFFLGSLSSAPIRVACADEEPVLAPSVQAFVDRSELAGAVMLVADKNGILGLEAAGWANLADKKPMKKDSIFWIASQSKPITGTAVMVLVDEGKISLDDPVEKYLPEFKGQMYVAEKDDNHRLLKKPRHPITIRNVLNHTSGLPFKTSIESPSLDLWPLELRVRSYAATPLDFDPDTQYQYSNAGINTAARVLEVVTGMSFDKFLDERFFKPLGMVDTTFWPNADQAARIATAYKPGAKQNVLEALQIEQLKYPLTDRHERFSMPAGGLFSTAADLSKFYRMLLNGGTLDGKKYLSEAAVKELTRRQTPAELKESYGLGFGAGGSTFGHGGAYSTNSFADVQQGRIYVWLVQHAGFPGEGGKSQEEFRKAAVAAFGPQ